MITLQELCQYLTEYLDTQSFKDYSPNGLQVEGKSQIQKIATGVSANLATIKAAVDEGVDLLLVHHGMFWERDSYVVSGSKKEKLELLLKNNITLLAYHLPLDAHKEVGNNWCAAREMGWTDLAPFAEMNGQFIGVKGVVPSMSQDEFKQKLEAFYQHPAHVAFGGPKEIKSAALVSGGAYKAIPEAAKVGVDAFITGNFDEPAWSMAYEERVNFYAMGHSATETIGPKRLGQHLAQEFSLDVQFLDIPNPF